MSLHSTSSLESFKNILTTLPGCCVQLVTMRGVAYSLSNGWKSNNMKTYSKKVQLSLP